MRIDVDVTASGPFFDGRAVRALRDYIDEAPYEVAGVGVDTMVDRFRQRVRNPTPYYEYLITRERRGFGEAVVWDGGEVAYGPWLAGLGTRNAPVTRFRGYDHLTHAYDQLQQRAGGIAEDLLQDRYLDRMN
jgi:hypothetical protein